MKSSPLMSLLLLCSLGAGAQVELGDQSYRVQSRGKHAGAISMSLANQGDMIVMNNMASGMIKLPNQPRKEFKATAKHVFDRSWVWKSSEIKTPLSDDLVKVTVGGGRVKLETFFDKRKAFYSYEYKGMVLPRRAFYNYLQRLPRQPVLEHKDVYLFNEQTLSVHKASWAYLGSERSINGPIHKYEIKGLDTIVNIDSKGNIVRVRELDAGLDLVK